MNISCNTHLIETKNCTIMNLRLLFQINTSFIVCDDGLIDYLGMNKLPGWKKCKFVLNLNCKISVDIGAETFSFLIHKNTPSKNFC